MLSTLWPRIICQNAPKGLTAAPASSWRIPLRSSYRTITSQAVDLKKKPYYITTPIFYVNAAPHVGHLYTLVLTDIYKRWQTVLGETNAEMLTGTDEHGIKIQKAAAKAGVDVKLFCDDNCEQFKKLVKAANIDHNYFIRTTDEDHKRAVEHAWRELQHRGYIYESKHEGWYAVGDETFYPEAQVHLIRDPATGRKLMASMETGREVEWTSETNYHFRLSAFKEKLLKLYEDNPEFVTPRSRLQEVIQSVVPGLEDLSISRPTERLTWGIRVPDDPSQTIYVWIDALMNYAVRAGYPFAPGQEDARGWPPDVQVIGKDIMRFHCVYWPALLMALGVPLPRRILSHAHWTMGKMKMSKSEGNVVNPFYAINRYGVDTIRYYLIHEGGIADDSNYENSLIVREYKKGLQGGLGNLVSRLVRGKRWNIRRAVERARDNNLPPMVDQDIQFRNIPETVSSHVESLMEALDCRGALHATIDTIHKVHFLRRTPTRMLTVYIDKRIHATSRSLEDDQFTRSNRKWRRRCRHLQLCRNSSHCGDLITTIHAQKNEQTS